MLVKIGEHWVCPHAVACISLSKHGALSEGKPINVSQEEADELIKEINAPLGWTNTAASSNEGGK